MSKEPREFWVDYDKCFISKVNFGDGLIHVLEVLPDDQYTALNKKLEIAVKALNTIPQLLGSCDKSRCDPEVNSLCFECSMSRFIYSKLFQIDQINKQLDDSEMMKGGSDE